jgi:hypothetical protein
MEFEIRLTRGEYVLWQERARTRQEEAAARRDLRRLAAIRRGEIPPSVEGSRLLDYGRWYIVDVQPSPSGP